MTSEEPIIIHANVDFSIKNAPYLRVKCLDGVAKRAGYKTRVYDKKLNVDFQEGNNNSSLLSTVRFFLSLKRRKIVIFGFPHLSIFFLLLLPILKLKHNTVIVDIVDLLDVKTKNPIFNIIKSLDQYLLKRVIYRLVSRKIVISSTLKEIYGKSSIVIPQIVESSFINRHEVDTLTFTYIGHPIIKFEVDTSVDNLKDRIDLIIDNLYSISNEESIRIKLNICGITREKLVQALPSLKDKTESSEYFEIEFKGNITGDEYEKVLQSTSYTILLRDQKLSTNAGFPTKVAESLAYGIPLVANYTSDLERYLSQKEHIIIDNIESKKEFKFKLNGISNNTPVCSNTLMFENFSESFRGLLDND